MKGKILSMVITLVLILSLFPFTALASELPTLEAPRNLTATLKSDSDFISY